MIHATNQEARPTKKWIEAQAARGHSADMIYEQAAGLLGSFGVAFFGHRGTPQQRAALRRAWVRILKYTAA